MMKYIVTILLLVYSSFVYSDDIELYVNNTATAERPNVLIILDNSPSMIWYPVGSNTRLGRGNETVNNPETRAHKAREIVIDLINDNPGVDFALQLFNYNNRSGSRNGGRIVYGFKDLSIPENKEALIKILDTDKDNTNNNYTSYRGNGTPLCETLYETYRYLSGGQIYYGNDDTSTPRSIISSGNYTSPFAGIKCNKEVTIIYITDGDPTVDNRADNIVKALTKTTNADADPQFGNFLGVLGSWMATKNWMTINGGPGDKDTAINIADTKKDDLLASVKIHTVGFAGGVNATNLLKVAARDGIDSVKKAGFHDSPAGGKYYTASTAEALKTALGSILLEVLGTTSLNSASVSANGFDRTQTSDSVYYGLFEPSNAARWQGNLKKYKIVNGKQVDALGNLSLDENDNFKTTSKSFWSSTVDGNDVTKGGVAEMLRLTATKDRKLLSDVKIRNKRLTRFNRNNVDEIYDTPEKLATLFNIPLNEVGDVTSHIRWAKGVDMDDVDSTSLIRPDVFGDPLHSKPLIVNYGNGSTRILIGTNAGVLHMFNDISETSTEGAKITESWAYFPKELFKNIKPLRKNNIEVNSKVYGLDGELTLYFNDVNNNGKVDRATDTAWLFFGLRRGGSSYYALDITRPNRPKLLWHINNNQNNSNPFKDLGLTFSKPQVVKSALNTRDKDKLVVIFGGGYDTKKDAVGPNTFDDDKGSAIYMVNARTGALILKKTTGSKNGIASTIASLDSDRDGLVDRLYAGDTGGNVWRVDIPDDKVNNTSIIKLASLGGVTNEDDRRFFNKPDIVRTYILETINTGTTVAPNIVKQEVPYDAILLGSGDKASPTATDSNDMFFMIKDKYIKTQKFGSAPATAPPDVVTLKDLYDYTDDPFNGYPDLNPTQESELLKASEKSGWHLNLSQEGEKSTAQSWVINNVVYFTSYTPSQEASCTVTPGNAWLYATDLELGIKKYNWESENESENREDRIKYMGSKFLGKPTLISTPVVDETTGETKTQVMLSMGDGVMLEVGYSLQTKKISLTVSDN